MLAYRLGTAFDLQQIIPDLKRQADLSGKSVQRIDFRPRDIRPRSDTAS